MGKVGGVLVREGVVGKIEGVRWGLAVGMGGVKVKEG